MKDGAQLHNRYPAPGQPSVAAHQKQLGPFTLWPCQYLLKSVTDAVTCLQKDSVFVNHHTTSSSSTWIHVWYAGTTTPGRCCTAKSLPTLITIPTLRISVRREKPVFDGCAHYLTSVPTDHLMKARGKC